MKDIMDVVIIIGAILACLAIAIIWDYIDDMKK